MRVAIVTSARTGSTFCLRLISTLLNLKNYDEILNRTLHIFTDGSYIFSDKNVTDKKIFNKLINTDDYVVKLISSELFNRDFNVGNFPWSIFDVIILLERDNIFEQIVSLYTLEYWQRSVTEQHQQKEYYITDGFIRFALNSVKKYHIVKDVITESTDKYFIVKKENIVEDISKIFNTPITKETIDKARERLSPECDVKDTTYDTILNAQNIKPRVLNILQQELYGKVGN